MKDSDHNKIEIQAQWQVCMAMVAFRQECMTAFQHFSLSLQYSSDERKYAVTGKESLYVFLCL